MSSRDDKTALDCDAGALQPRNSADRPTLVADWLAADGPIARRHPEFERRDEQHAMAAAVADAFATPHHLAVEAGTGVGKTFAYLLPALQEIAANKRRVVISTHTIALQEQLFQKDIPFLQNALELDFRAELVKGRNNYLSLRRLKGASERQKTAFPRKAQLRALHAVEDWAYETSDGSLADMAQAPPLDVWEKVRSEHGNCLGRRCPTFTPCFYQRARRRALEADLLVVNHALLVSDLLLRREQASLLPEYDLLVIDEAHTLEQVAIDHFGSTISSTQVFYLLNSLFNDRTAKGLLANLAPDSAKQLVIDAMKVANHTFDALARWQRDFGRSNGRLVRRDPIENELTPKLRQVRAVLEKLREKLPREEDQIEVAAAAERAENLAENLAALLEQRHEAHVYWISEERGGNARVSLSAAPLDVGPALRELLFDRLRSVVLTSATLAAGDDDSFKYLLGRLGEPTAQTLRLGSPYDFQQQLTLHLEVGMPDPSAGSRYTEAVARASVCYLRQTEGRAFVLFTSYQMLDDVATLIRDDLDAEGYTILAQGEGLPRSRMLDTFRNTERCVILGTDSFWQGVDVAGEALANVIITKLPFAVPTRPTVEARLDLIRARGGNPFVEYSLPDAILRFRQGFGRLIRSRTDRGIVVVLDPRISRKSYGQRFLASLPPCRIETSQQPW